VADLDLAQALKDKLATVEFLATLVAQEVGLDMQVGLVVAVVAEVLPQSNAMDHW
jgi:hypothetical protein